MIVKSPDHNKFKFRKNERGFITLDFLFSFVLVMGFTSILAALTMTLSVVELTQYASYVAARNYSAGHINEEEQRNIANIKYQELFSDPVVNGLLTGNWFDVSSQPIFANFSQEFGSSDPNEGEFIGARVSLNAKVLGFSIPFFGSTINDETEEGFNTQLSSYLGKEPTQEECGRFAINRFEWIKSLGHSKFNSVDTRSPNVFSDNGC